MNMAKVGYLRRSYTFLSEWLGSPHIQIRGLYINQNRNQCRGLGMRFCWALVSTKNCLKIERIHSKVLGRASNGGDLANIYPVTLFERERRSVAPHMEGIWRRFDKSRMTSLDLKPSGWTIIQTDNSCFSRSHLGGPTIILNVRLYQI